ncbi:hypothetical protein FQN60_002526 [Etheostoma spectabile]|uniref:Uncharacterized protein n=1 Tax=Etheostoma spectabile TaxID=54343 RepID=A0A5J5CAP0_9PERO|nr:hypothetical protein FQN60_002526 [Etheostoma spectabile]
MEAKYKSHILQHEHSLISAPWTESISQMGELRVKTVGCCAYPVVVHYTSDQPHDRLPLKQISQATRGQIHFLKGLKERKMRITISSWHLVYSALWGLATGAFPSSVQIVTLVSVVSASPMVGFH